MAVLHCGAYTTVFAHVWGPLPPTTHVLGADGEGHPVVTARDLEAAVRRTYGYDLDLHSGRYGG